MENLERILDKRKADNRFRELSFDKPAIDFSSNDYLGFASSSVFRNQIDAELAKHRHYKNGSTGSRLLSGNTAYAEQLEKQIAEFHGADAALIFNSGYDANVGLFS